MAAIATAPLPVLPIQVHAASPSAAPPQAVVSSPGLAVPVAPGGSPAQRLVVTPVHSPASLGLGNFMQGPSPTNRQAAPGSSPVLLTPPAARSNVCPSPTSAAVCGSTLSTQVAPVVQTVRRAGQRVKETPCVAVSLEKVGGFTVAAKEAVTNVAYQSIICADNVGNQIAPHLDTAITRYCIPACGKVSEVHTEYVVPTVTRARDQYVVPAVARAGELADQAKTTYMNDYHHQYVVPSVNRTIETVGQLPQRLSASTMRQQPQEQQAQQAQQTQQAQQAQQQQPAAAMPPNGYQPVVLPSNGQQPVVFQPLPPQ